MIQLPPPLVSTPEELLAEFEKTGDTAPFEEIVRRYSGMVYGVCYRVTRNAHDAEDAAQATFLKLATHARVGFVSAKSGTSGGLPRVGPWLQQVAKTTAVDLRRSKTRRQNREQIRAAIEEQQQPAINATDDASMDELKQLLREEVDRLPVHYRTPLILYYFGGLSTEQIAVELKTNAKALAVRLFRARKMLGTRLSSRGIATAGGSLASLAVVDAILAALAGNVWKASAGGYYASAAASSGMAATWSTSHSAICAVISSRINSTLRAAAIGLAASKWKMSITILLTVGTTMAGTSDLVQQTPVVRDVGRWLTEIGQTLRDLGNVQQIFRSVTPRLQAAAEKPPDPAVAPSPAPVPVKPIKIEPVVPPVTNLPLATQPPLRPTAMPHVAFGSSTELAAVPPLRPATVWNPATDHLAARQLVPSAGKGDMPFSSTAGAALLAMTRDGGRQANRLTITPDQSRGRQVLGESATDNMPFVGPIASAASQSQLHPLMAGGTGGRVGPYAPAAGSTAESSPETHVSMEPPVDIGPVASRPAYGGIGITQDGQLGSTFVTTETATGLGAVVQGYDGRIVADGGLTYPEMTVPYDKVLEFIDPAPVLSPAATPPATQPIPEPAVVSLLAIGAAGLLARRRRRFSSSAKTG